MELLEQILGQEGEQRILCGPDLVVLIQLQKFTQFLILCEGRHHRPLLPQASLGRVKTDWMFQAIHESSASEDSDAHAGFCLLLEAFTTCNCCPALVLHPRSRSIHGLFHCRIFSLVFHMQSHRHGRRSGNRKNEWTVNHLRTEQVTTPPPAVNKLKVQVL